MADALKNYRFLGGGLDYTFRFYPNGTVAIINNATNTMVQPKDLSGPPLEFFAKKKILFIKNMLIEANRKAAG